MNNRGESVSPGPRERILAAALELFVEQGFFNTNVPDISTKSCCSVGSIYHHFLNKEEIAFQLYRDGILSFRAALLSKIVAQEPLEELVRSVVHAFLSFSEENPRISKYLWFARHSEFLSTKISMPTTVGFDELGRTLTRSFKGGIRRGEIKPLKADIIWSIVFGIPLSFTRDWMDGYTKISPKQAAPSLASACWCALQGA